MVTSKLRNSWCSPKLTSMQETSSMTALDLCFTEYNPFSLSSAKTPPYTSVLVMVTSKLRNSWCSPKLTSMQETTRMTALVLCFTEYHPFSLSSANGPPYTTVLRKRASMLHNSWSSPKLTSMQKTGAIIAISVHACLLLFANPRPALQQRQHSPQIRHRLQLTRCGCIPAQRGCSAVSLPSFPCSHRAIAP